METTKTTLTVSALLLLTLTSGCQSTGSRFAWWKPGSSTDAPSAVAHSAPQLPSARFASDGNTAAPLADAGNEGVKPELSPETLASAPKADYPSVFPSSPPEYKKPAWNTGGPEATGDQPAASVAMAPQTSPYSTGAPASTSIAATVPPSSPAEELPATSNPPATASSPPLSTDRYAAASTDRYAAPTDRYAPPVATPPAVSAPAATVASANTGPIPKPTDNSSGFDRFSRYSLTTPANSPAGAASLPAPPADDNVASRVAASIPSPAVGGGGYRPGGTSSYPTTQASAVNIATRPAGAESSSAYSKPNADTNTAPSSYR